MTLGAPQQQRLCPTPRALKKVIFVPDAAAAPTADTPAPGAQRTWQQAMRQQEKRPAPKLMNADFRCVYTDGSKMDDHPCCGSGVYDAFTNTGHSYRFSGEQTVPRAELAAIHSALSLHPAANLLLATDSLTSLQLIARAIERPHTVSRHRHAALLVDIVSLIIARSAAGQRTQLRKVLAHSGVSGNEKADALAKAAVIGEEYFVELDLPPELPRTLVA
jgi:ribonuclease HI